MRKSKMVRWWRHFIGAYFMCLLARDVTDATEAVTPLLYTVPDILKPEIEVMQRNDDDMFIAFS